MVCEQTCACCHKMNKSFRQTLGAFDLLCSSYKKIQAILLCGNTAQQCRLGLLEDYAFAGDLEDSKSTSGGILFIFGSHTFVPISWMCKKQTSVSHSSTEAEIISLDAGSRMDGIPALTLWDLVPHQTNKTKDVREPRGNLSATPQPNMRKQIPTTHTNRSDQY